MEYLLVLGAAVAAGVVPVAAYIGYRAVKSRRRHREAGKRRARKIEL